MIWIRSALFWLAILILTPLYAVLGNLIRPLPPMWRYKIMSSWARFMVLWMRLTCGLRYKVIGTENIPTGPAMVMSKHQSAWETMALQKFFPPQVWVMKRELLKLPFFGWAISTLSPIAIDRSNRSEAQKLLMAQGRDRIAKGFWIVIFPEGTRIAPGKRGQYKHGGARLATEIGVPIVPEAESVPVLEKFAAVTPETASLKTTVKFSVLTLVGVAFARVIDMQVGATLSTV